MDKLTEVKLKVDRSTVKHTISYYIGRTTKLVFLLEDSEDNVHRATITMNKGWTGEHFVQALDQSCKRCPVKVTKALVIEMTLLDVN